MFRLRAAWIRTLAEPEEADPAGFSALSEEERAAAVEAWKAHRDRVAAERRQWTEQEKRALEAALRLDPEVEEAEELARRLESLRSDDPEARRAAWQEAERLLSEGRAHYDEGRIAAALASFRRATSAYPDHLPALVSTAAAAYALLKAPAGESEEEKALSARLRVEAFEALAAADALDVLDRFPTGTGSGAS